MNTAPNPHSNSNFGGGGIPHYSSPPIHIYHGGGYSPSVAPPQKAVVSTARMLKVISVIILLFIVFFVAIMSKSSGITKSTIERTKLDKQYTTSTEFYVDELDWIRNSTSLNNSLKSFYNQTGVHPLLYITDTVNGTQNPSATDMEEYSEQLYQELCPDEGHILLLFHCLDGGTDYSMWYTCGAQAKTVMDEEACNILMDYIDAYFYTDKTEDDMFGDAFEDAGKRIMTKTVSPIIPVTACGTIIIIMVIGFTWWKKAKTQKNLEAKQTAEILRSDLHTFSEGNTDTDEDLTELENKYE